jgi:heme exporter protein A
MSEGVAVHPNPRAAEAMEASPALEVRGLGRLYGDRHVLHDVSVSVATGETLAVIGPNGAGKTTFLRVVATLLRPSAGRVTVLGASLPADAWRVRGELGLLADRPMLYRDLTVEENLRFHARLHGVSEPTERIRQALALAGLERRAGDLVGNLSAGLAQRAAACRAVLHEPRLLLLDEPRSHLDPGAASMLDRLIGPVPGRTRVVVSHDVDAALAEADRVLALRADGGVGYEGPAAGLSPGDARAIYGGTA